ncbi:hypothetical protein GE061_016312 [Apolygus lucorum]|uniref:U2A'/phosphoprotein 32 family A C-terminal domain-containing protein n=1 Tax=Apolygus lucorum TaxID=248454 RepID=A0A6A4K4I4_APOLU|nr:hypothetical protein GE061_016312 [Apolygus lucorum]
MTELTEEMVFARTKTNNLDVITKLNCWGSQLSDVSIVRKMTNVTALSLSVNNIKTLEDFQHCTKLQELFVRKNKIKDLNEVCYLRDLVHLKNLWLGDNPCADDDGYRLAVIRALPRLEKLDGISVEEAEYEKAQRLGRNLTLDPSDERDHHRRPLEMMVLTEEMVFARTKTNNLGVITKLNCWGSQLSDVSIVRKMTNVTVLSLSVNNIETLEDFQHCTKLQELFVRKNKIKDLNEVCYLRDLVHLKNLWLGDNPCADDDGYRLAVIRALPRLEKLDGISVEEAEYEKAQRLGRNLTLDPADERNKILTANMKQRPSVKLEVDPSIIERNLLFTERTLSPANDSFDPISKLLSKSDDKNLDEVPWKYVRPNPGFCVKTRTLEGDKVFINICYTDEIPSPRDISDEELIKILESDEASSYTVPLSLGDLHIEADKSDNTCSVYDVAISTSFYNKILKNQLFKTFLMTVIMEGIESKYKLDLVLREEKPYVILKNRKHLGTIQSHRIQQRKAKEPPKKLIEIISSSEETETAKISELPVEKGGLKALSVDDNNKLRLFAVPGSGEVQLLLVLAKIKALTGNDIEMDVSSRRLIISCYRNETVDCVLPYPVQPENAVAQYFVNLQELMEVISGASHGSYSFVHENFIYRINKFTNKRVYLSCRLSYCRGAGKGVKGATRGQVYNFTLTKPHNHPAEEHKIRLFEVKQYVRDEARLTEDSCKDIYERAVQLFNCYDISRACVEGLVKRSRERKENQSKNCREDVHLKRKLVSAQGGSSSDSEEPIKKGRESEDYALPNYEDLEQGVTLEECDDLLFEDVGEAAVVEIVQTQEIKTDDPPVKSEDPNSNVASGIIVSADSNMILEWDDDSWPGGSNHTGDDSTQESGEYSESEPESSQSSDDLDDLSECPRSKARPSSEPYSEVLLDEVEDSTPSAILCSKRTNKRVHHKVSDTEDEDIYDNQESLEESLLKIYSTSYFRSKENAFKLLTDPQEGIGEENDGTHSMSTSNTLKVIKSAFRLCRFASVKACQVKRLLIGKTNELNDLEDVLIEHLSSLMCFSGTEFFQKCFGESLRETIEIGKRSDVKSKLAWSEEEIVERGSDKRMQLAVALQCYSGRAYSVLGELVDLPGPHITRKWATNFDGYPGFTGQAFTDIRDQVIRLKERTINVCLTMEDVPLRRAIDWEDAQVSGFTDLGFGRVDSDGIPEATRAIIFYASALNANWKMPVGYCFADYLSPQVRSNLLCQYISKLEFCGVKCIGVVLNDSVTTNQIYGEFGVFGKGALPQGTFHTNADEKLRVSPFVDTMEVMQSLKSFLKEKKVFIAPTGFEVLWSHIQYAEELFGSDSTDWITISGRSSPEFLNYMRFLTEKLNKDDWPFGKYLLVALKVLKKIGVAEFSNADATISFVSAMVTITEVFCCSNKFLENRLRLPNHKDTFTTVNKWIHYIGNMKLAGGQFIRDSGRKMPLMNLCMNLSSLKIVVRRTFDSSQDGLLNRFSLDNVRHFVKRMGFGRDAPLPTPSEFRNEYFKKVCVVNTSASSNLIDSRDRGKSKPRLKIDSTFYVSKTYVYTPVKSMCDCIEDFFLEKIVNVWMDSSRCAECYEIMLSTMQNYSPINPGMYKDLLWIFRRAERLLCSMGEFPVDFAELGPGFNAFANSVLANLTNVRGFFLHDHLFNSVEFGEVCHFTEMVKDMLRIFLQLRLLYLSQEIKIGINDFQESSLKYSVGHFWA